MYGICTEIIFTKYKEEVQVLTTVNEFKDRNPSSQHYANYHEIRSHMRRFIIRIYGRRSNVLPHLRALFSVEWVISIKLFKVVANVGNPPLCSEPRYSGSKWARIPYIHCNFTVFAPPPRWRHKPWKGLFLSDSDLNAKIITVLKNHNRWTLFVIPILYHAPNSTYDSSDNLVCWSNSLISVWRTSGS